MAATKKPTPKAKATPKANPKARAKPRTVRKAIDAATVKSAAQVKSAAKAIADAQVKSAAKAKAPPPPAWQEVLDTLLANPGMTRKNMFGADAVGLLGKYFAMYWQGALIVKLPRDRVDELVAAGLGTHFDPDPLMGRPMREWLHVTASSSWGPLVEQGLSHCIAQRT